MYNYSNSYAQPTPYGLQLDLSAVMRRVYLWLALGLALGFGVAFAIGQWASAQIASGNTAGLTLIYNPVVYIIGIIAYIGIAFAFYPVVRRASISTGLLLYFIFTAVFGFMISSIFVVYSQTSIWETLLATAGMFGVMALIGYTTKIDLSRLGGILLLALIGILVASLINFFLASSVLYWIVTYAGIAIFCGLVAYDMQWIKRNAVSLTGGASEVAVERVALIGAFHLFLDFVNLFLFLLRIFGRRN
jgi:FtsH-binding integral membrane protein